MCKAHSISMAADETHQTDGKMVRITITLNEKVYDDIKRISKEMGLRPSTWITMVSTSKANNLDLKVIKEE